MPKVPFSLQPVLDYRENLVDLLGRQLAQLQAQRLASVRRLEALAGEREDILSRWETVLLGRLDVARVGRYRTYLRALQDRMAEQRAIIAELDGRIAAKRQEVIRAMEDKEMLVKLRERRLREYVADQERREAAFADEMAVSRYARQRAGQDT